MANLIMKWFDTYRSPVLVIGKFFDIRLRQLYILLVIIAGVISLHSNLLHLGEIWNDRLVLLCLVLLGLNHSIVEK